MKLFVKSLKVLSIAIALVILAPHRQSFAQSFDLISDKYTCVRFVDGTNSLALNIGDGAYSLVNSGTELKTLRENRRKLRKYIVELKALKGAIRNGDFDKDDRKTLLNFLKRYLPSDTNL